MFPPPPPDCSSKFLGHATLRSHNTCTANCQLFNQQPYSGGASSSGGSHMSYNSPIMRKKKGHSSSKSSSGSQGSHNSSLREHSLSETLQIHSDASGNNEKSIVTDLIIQNPCHNNLKNQKSHSQPNTLNYHQQNQQIKLPLTLQRRDNDKVKQNYNKNHNYQHSFYNPHHPNITILHEESESMRESEAPSDSDWYSQPDTAGLSSQSSAIESAGPSDTECPTDESGSSSDHPISHVHDMDWTKALHKAGEIKWKRRSSISSTDESSYPCETKRRVKKSNSGHVYTNVHPLHRNSDEITSPVV